MVRGSLCAVQDRELTLLKHSSNKPDRQEALYFLPTEEIPLPLIQ